MDRADGGQEWRGGAGEKLVDARGLRFATQRLESLCEVNAFDDGVHAAMYALRGGALLGREAMGLAEPKLYERARTGGPDVVRSYLEAAVTCLEMVERRRDASVPTEARLAFFNECRHAHGRTALLLSGGAGLGAYHLGVVAALRDQRLLPRVISGASAGSIVAATVCCRSDAELGHILDNMGATLDDDDVGEYHLPPPADRVAGDPIFRLDFFRWRSSNNLFLRGKRELRRCASSSSDNIFPSTSSLRRSEEAPFRTMSSCPSSPPRENLLAASKAWQEEDLFAGEDSSPSQSNTRRRRRVSHEDSSFSSSSESEKSSGRRHRSETTTTTTLMCGDHLARVIRTNLGGDLTFQEAFDKTGKILNIPVREHDATGDNRRVKAFAPPRLLNYLTAPHVVVWSASRASCALPAAFAPSPLLVRGRDGVLRYEDDDDPSIRRRGEETVDDTNGSSSSQLRRKPRTVYVDGSMGADLPFETMRTLFNCNHFVCSQTNVHAACFGDSALRLISAVAPGVRAPGLALTSSSLFDVTHAVLNFVKAQLRTWIRDGTALLEALSAALLHVGHNRGDLAHVWESVVPWQLGAWAIAVMTQPYEGRAQDVTIVPFAGHLSAVGSFFTTIKNPERGASIADVIAAAQKNTWRELAKIRDHTSVEYALERAVHRLRKDLFRERAQPSGIGRTPSFYTSASILQLSGLAVVDPLVNVRRPSFSTNERAQDDVSHGDFLPGKRDDLSVRTRRAASADGLVLNSLAEEEQPPRHKLPEDPFCKTSSMADFYYRRPPKRRHSTTEESDLRSHSDDKLAYRSAGSHPNLPAQHSSPSNGRPPVIKRNSSVISDNGPEFF